MSRLVGNQCLKWADGTISAAGLAELCADALEDGFENPMLQRFGGIRADQHAHMDLMKMISELTPALDVVTDLEAGSHVKHILRPSSVVKSLLKYHPQEIGQRLGGEVPRLLSFWRQFRRANRENLDAHPILGGKSLQELQFYIPVTIHEDAGPISKAQGATIVSWSSLLALGSEKVSHYPIGTWTRPKTNWDRSRLDPFWDATMRDFSALAAGVVAGQEILPLSSGECLKIVLLFAKGDEQVRADEWFLHHYNAADECCPDCHANRSTVPFTDCRSVAAWRQAAPMSMDQYRDRMKRPLHRMTASRFFWHNFYYPDYMHLLDCRGISAIIYGSILDTLLHRPSVGSNMAARLALLNHMKEQWYNQHPGFIRLPEFTRASLKMADGWCELHGPNVKAANTRQASGLIRHLAWTLCTEDTILDATIREVAASLDSLYQIMHESPMFFC